MFLQPRNLFIERLPVLHQHFHPFRKGGITHCPEFCIVFDFLDRHTSVFQAFDEFNPCEVFIGIAAAVAGIALRGNQPFLFIAARRRDNLEMLKKEILQEHPDLGVVIRSTDLSVRKMRTSFMRG